jgi:hypothetical protein
LRDQGRSVYKQSEHFQEKKKSEEEIGRKGKKCNQVIKVNIILGPKEIKYSII